MKKVMAQIITVIVMSLMAVTVNAQWGVDCTGIPSQPVGETNLCAPTSDYLYTTTGAEFAESYEWTLIPASAGTISGTGITATVNWSESFNGSVDIKVQGVKEGCIGEYSILNVEVNNTLANPGSFSLSSPANGTWANATPLFQWAPSTGANHYDLYIDGVLFKGKITSTSYQVLSHEALSSGMHTWYVVAANGCTTQSNETRSFLVDATPPSAFNLISPTDNSWTTEIKPTLSWSASSDAQSGLAKYQLWINGSLNRDDISPSATSTTPLSNLRNQSYSWYIKAIDNAGNETQSNEVRTIGVDFLPPGAVNNYLNCQNNYISLDGELEIPSSVSFEFWINLYVFKTN